MKKLFAFLGTTFLAFALFAAPTEAATYTVTEGDSLFKIAQKHGITVAKLKTTNNLKSNTIQAGQQLVVPTAKETTSKSTATSATAQVAENMAQQQTTKPAVKEERAYKTIRVTSTAYTAYCRGCSGVTATGINLKKNPNMKVIAVDPRVIPLGSKVWVEGYGEAIAGDTGGAIKGNKIDVFLPTTAKAKNWGRRTVTIKVYQ
ncbi:3D domain-containing protein [Caryophanon tenue]|uniref:LysM domain-containing protein n=1 Tax=Caryophanon tenue TaxID=33978 RepID=A0A1C0Y652_9BACL|nr:3D domain-containing protein [Caryophanon tenue]OCS82636.1 hypothetical protein A6M13_07065 [Caryophanon tenue]